MTAPDAQAAARGLVSANVNGVDSHGVLRLSQYVASLAAGDINATPDVVVTRNDGPTASVDADGGYGYRPSFLAADILCDIVSRFGVGVVGVGNSHHFGMAGLYTRYIASRGFIALAWTNASAKIAPTGSVTPTLGNNPLSWAVPRRAPEPPIVLDMALSTVAFGKIRLARAEGRPIPSDWGLDAQGAPTTDAEIAFQAGMLAPIGGYKGYGLSLVGEVLAGCMTGSPFGIRGEPHGNVRGGVGHFFMAVRPDLFVSMDDFEASVDQLVADVRAAEVAVPGGSVYLPGEIEAATSGVRTSGGIPISAELAAQLVDLATSLDVAVPRDLQNAEAS
jgi:LDH2 family malate/lactate/ureidoglycolate dehydrogenase